MLVILPWQHIVCCTVDPPSSDRLREPLKTRKVMKNNEMGDKNGNAKGVSPQLKFNDNSNYKD